MQISSPTLSAQFAPAEYTPTGVSRFDGNAFIEALPPLADKKQDFVTMLANDPPRPTAKTRKLSEVVRMMEIAEIDNLVVPFPEYTKAGLVLARLIRDAYVSRNPLTALDRQRRHALASGGKDGISLPRDWKSSAKGHMITAISGMGKTTFARTFLLRYPQVIQHTAYRGDQLKCVQVVYLHLRMPHDATLRGLCIQFFREIDKLLGTNYTRQARALRNISPMIQLMNLAATAVSLGLLVIDEVQNLKSATSANADIVLNLFSEIIEGLGISLLVLATPAIGDVLEGSVRNARKLLTGGETVLRPMSPKDPMWQTFCEKYWEYGYVKRHGRLTPEVKNAWYMTSGGNSAFASLSFMLSQFNEIGGREVVDELAFERTAATDMAFLQPAIHALISRKPAQLRAFDDLVFSRRYVALRRLLGVEEPQIPKMKSPEFDDLEGETAPPKKRRRGANQPVEVEDFLPIEDPFEA